MLPHRLVPTYKKGDRGRYQLVVSEKACKRLKMKIKALTRKTTIMSFDERIAKINKPMRQHQDRMNQLFSRSKYSRQTQIFGWMVAKSNALLNLD
jgi:RNA-directed DNA polymerase